MKAARVPIQKIGTVFQRPSWRYDAMINPDKYGFRSLCTRKKETAGAYKRQLTKGIPFEVTYKIPPMFRQLMKELSFELSEQLTKVWNKHYKKTAKTKIRFQDLDSVDHFVSWNMAKVEKLNDLWLKKLVAHSFNKEYSDDIQFAISFHHNKELVESKRYLGYEIFSGSSDEEIAKKWNMSPKRIEAIRMLFFDFSHFPPDKIAQWALLKQLCENNDIHAQEFGLYKRVYDMGKLGLKAQLCHNHLNEKERTEVADYLSKSAMENTFNLQFSIKTAKDALTYNKAISDMAKIQLQKAEMENKRAELRIMELQICKLKKEVNVETDSTQPEDLRLLQEHINRLSYKDGVGEYLNVASLHSK